MGGKRRWCANPSNRLSVIAVSEHRYIRASELGSYVFCKRSWYLARRNAPSRLGAERDRGTQFHHQHGQTVRSAAIAGRLATWCAVAAVILLALGVWLALR
jgi:hypothetical protein